MNTRSWRNYSRKLGINHVLFVLAAVIFLLVVSILGSTAASAQSSPDGTSEPDIVGGIEAPPGAWPWQAALVDAGTSNGYYGQFCGGSLIAPNWVVTAAHCVVGLSPYSLDIVLGRHRLSSGDGERIGTAQIIIHPRYDESTADSDIALVRLRQDSAQQSITAYNWPTSGGELSFLQAVITGWGRYLPDSDATSDTLREVTVPVVSRAVCNQTDALNGRVTLNMFCTGYEKGGKGACQGDSGGPVVARESSGASWKLIGIVSWGSKQCSGEKRYSVHTLVPNFNSWINACLKEPYSANCSGGDQYEPDDSMASAKAASRASQFRNFHNVGDQDWIKFTAVRGATYIIQAYARDREGDTILWLYDGQGKPLAFNDHTEPGVSRITWQAKAAGTYFIQVQNYSNQRGAQYELRFTEIRHVYLPVVRR